MRITREQLADVADMIGPAPDPVLADLASWFRFILEQNDEEPYFTVLVWDDEHKALMDRSVLIRLPPGSSRQEMHEFAVAAEELLEWRAANPSRNMAVMPRAEADRLRSRIHDAWLSPADTARLCAFLAAPSGSLSCLGVTFEAVERGGLRVVLYPWSQIADDGS